MQPPTIHLELPAHLRQLAACPHTVVLSPQQPVTIASTLDALEAAYPALRGTIRDHSTKLRRPFIRFFACEEDLSHSAPDTVLPEPVLSGREPLLIIGAIAGG